MRDMWPFGRASGKDLGLGALENMKGMLEAMERAIQEPWQATGARVFGGEWMPRVDLTESEKDVVVKAMLPGLERDDIHVSASDSTLSLRGVRKGKGQGEETYTFYRSFTLPSTIRPDEVRASYKDGVLTVTMPKAKHSQVKRITIH